MLQIKGHKLVNLDYTSLGMSWQNVLDRVLKVIVKVDLIKLSTSINEAEVVKIAFCILLPADLRCHTLLSHGK